MPRAFPRVAATWAAAVLLLAHAPAQSVYPTGTTVWQPGLTDPGYTLYKAQGGFAVLIDMDGSVVNTWNSPVANHELFNLQPLDNGHILAYTQDATIGNTDRQTVGELDYDGNVVWFYSLPGTTSAVFHHDVERLPNGNTMMLGVQSITVPPISPLELLDDFIMEIDPVGNVVWSWETWAHFDEFGFNDCAKGLISDQGGDWAHANTISVIPPNNHTDPAFAEGNIIVSYRFTNTVCIIDKVSGNIVWSLGPDPDNITWGQHQAHMIEMGKPGEGNILIFDNGSGTGYCPERRAPGRSSVVEIDPVTKSVVWSYGDWFNFWSNIVSGCERLSNGNTLICSGVKGRIFEVMPDGEIVWEYMSPYFIPQGPKGKRRLVYRAYRLPYSWVP